MSASRGGRKLEAAESRKMKRIEILAFLALSACANLPSPTASYSILPRESLSDKVPDQLDGPTTHPATLTAVEAQKAAKARFDSPLDPDKPATKKAKQISLTPPAGKVEIGNE
jgi:hypothetical protein